MRASMCEDIGNGGVASYIFSHEFNAFVNPLERTNIGWFVNSSACMEFGR
jgi:hypothetical protein